MTEDLVIGVAFDCHDCGTYLAQTYAVTPSFAFQHNPVTLEAHIKSGALEMAFRQYSSDFQLFTYYQD